MKNAFLMILLAVLTITIVTGCSSREIYQDDPALHQAAQTEGFFITEPREVDLVEKLAASRAGYYADVEALKDYYLQTGNQRKLDWAKKEASWLEKGPKYKYLMPAETAGTELVARDAISAADKLFEEGMNAYRQAVIIPVVPNRSKIRLAITKFNKVIDNYPTSDKVDDAAYRAGELYERFNDFSLAANYYQKAYLWDEYTPYPARYKAARLLDYKLKRRDEALALYRLAVEKEAQFDYYAAKAKERIAELTVPEIVTDPIQQSEMPEETNSEE